MVRRKLTGRPLALGDREQFTIVCSIGGWGRGKCWESSVFLTTGAAATAATVFRMDALAWIIATTVIVLMIRLRVFGHREFGLIHQWVRRQTGNLAQSKLSHEIVTSVPD